MEMHLFIVPYIHPRIRTSHAFTKVHVAYYQLPIGPTAAPGVPDDAEAGANKRRAIVGCGTVQQRERHGVDKEVGQGRGVRFDEAVDIVYP